MTEAVDKTLANEATPAVSIVLCTYNGAKYLPEFLQSLAAQTLRIERIVWRDDGSNDGSPDIVLNWAQRHRVPTLQLSESGSRLGPARSFLTALAASTPARVHLLADQDDVWLPNKVARAVEALRRAPPGRVLYASRQQIVDAALHPIRLSPIPGELSLHSAIYESLLTGCTMALTEELRLLAAREVTDSALMHDWWLYLLASATGHIVFDEQPTLLYRQHEQNTIGAGPSGVTALLERLRRAVGGTSGGRSAQLRSFERIYGDTLPPEAARLVRSLVSSDSSLWERTRVAWTVPIARRTWLDRAGTRLSIARNRF